MRRKIGYCLFTGSLILAAAALVGPTVVGLDTDLTYGSGRDLVFKISKADTTYGGIKTDDYVGEDDPDAVTLVGDEMESRLKTWGVEAEVVKEGYDTIRVKIRSPKNDETEYQYIENYLAFSGGSFTVGSSIDNTEDYESIRSDLWENPFQEQSARIEYISTSSGSVPAVVVPLKDNDDLRGEEGAFNSLIKYCKDNTKEANESEGTEAQSCYLVLWANKQEGDTYSKAQSSNSDYDQNVSKRLIFAEGGTEAWFEEDDEDDNYTEFQLIPSSAAITSEGYDSSKAGAAYKAAFFYKNILNANSYKDMGTDGYDVSFAFYTETKATVETLYDFWDWNMHPSFGATFIATIVSVAFLAVLLVTLYRMGALAILSNIAIAVMGSLLMFSYFSAQFGVGALIGLALIAVITAFGGIYYFSKFKEQVYQGRSLKKSHEEAIKRAMWPTIDAGILGIIIGLCVYGFIPSVVGKLGLMLVLGSFFGTLSNLLVLRLEGYMLANDADVEKNYAKVYNIQAKKVPDLAKEEKPTYFGAFATKDFSKHSKLIAIISGLCCIASIIGVTTFTALSGTPYNYSNAYSDTTISYIEYRVDEGTPILAITDEADLQSKILNNIYIVENGEKKSLSYSSVSKETGSVYLTQEEKTMDVNYYMVEWASHYDVGASSSTYEFVFAFNGSEETVTTDFNDAITHALNQVISDNIYVSTKNVEGEATQPSIGTVWLGLGVGLLIATFYMVVRYRLSRGIATGVLATASALIAIGFFSLTRIIVTPLVSIAGISSALLFFLGSLFVLAKEKELAKDSREKDKDSLAFRTLCISNACSQGAESYLAFAFISAFSFLWYLGFMPSNWTMVYLGIMVGVVIVSIILLTLLAPSSILLARGFSRINVSIKPKKKETVATSTRRRNAEPEEAIFIGIND